MCRIPRIQPDPVKHFHSFVRDYVKRALYKLARDNSEMLFVLL